MAVTPITPAPEAQAYQIYFTTQAFATLQWISGLIGVPIPFVDYSLVVEPNAGAIRSAMISGGKDSGIFGVMDGALAAGQGITALNNQGGRPGDGPYNFILIRNPGLANGGFASRFDWLYSAIFGQSSISGTGITSGGYKSAVYQFNGAYDFFSDFPVNINPVSIANSLAQALLPLNYTAQLIPDLAPITGTTTLRQQQTGATGTGTLYSTMVPQYNALMFPLRIPGMITTLTGFNFADVPIIGSIPIIGNPVATLTAIANAYEPAMNILINSGYNDVNTTNWTRSFQNYGTNSLFFFDEPFPIEKWLGAIQAAGQSAAENTVPLIQPAVNEISKFALDIFNTVTPVVQPYIDGAIQAVVDFLKSLLGNIIPIPAVSPSAAAATLSSEAAENTSVQPAAVAADESDAPPAIADDADDGSKVAAVERVSASDVATDATPSADGAAPAPNTPLVAEEASEEAPVETAPAESATDTAAADADTAQERLDAAAERARARAESALAGAQDRVNRVNGAPEGASTQTTTTAPDSSPADAPAGQGSTDNSAPSSGDAPA